jgi:hypothetical protein
MNRILSATLKGLVVFCALFSSITFASDKLAAVNAEVEKKAEEIDQKYGVLLTTQERQNLKIAIVVKRVATAEAANSEQSAKDIADAAIVTYEIEDTTEQRKLLIETEAAMAEFGGSGTKPPCCE